MTGAACYIHRPSSTRFQARVRYAGYRRSILVGKPTTSLSIAIMRMAREFSSGNYKRGDVLATADYYDPMMLVEMVKR
ncbi:MAG: hypothetical protein GEU91_18615 [Rhizobiales bacterium]|nr:hypothetical protein [Hyphomicrobiales bacterium]